MTVWPLISRELRAESRHTLNYGLRLVGAAGLLALFMLIWVQQQALNPNSGAQLFATLNAMLFAGIWLFGPLLTADCISGERREGTLGLLFLTPLQPADIVVAKVLTHGVRAMSLMLAAIPILMIPVLMGGVTWADAVRALLLDLGALILALTAGLFASSICREWVRTMILSLSLSFLSAVLFVGIHGICRALQLFPKTGLPFTLKGFLYFLWPYAVNRLSRWTFGSDPILAPVGMTSRSRMLSSDLISVLLAVGLLLFACILAVLVMWLAARRIRSFWQDKPPSRRTLQLLRIFCTPLFWQGLFHQTMRRKLERNPISWLHQYSWSARLTKWGWCILIVCIETILATNMDPWDMLAWQYWLANLVFLGLSFAAVSSFRKERQTGALELLLVTPLTEAQVIGGRLWGVWLQFLPTMAVLLVVALPGWGASTLFASGLQNKFSEDLMFLISLAARYATIPILGLYFSMCRLHYILAGVLTFTLATCVPWLLLILLHQTLFFAAVPHSGLWNFLLIAFQAGLGLVGLHFLNRNLKRRDFSFT